MNTLTRVELHGLKSIKNMTLTLGRINVLIGANGAGKSNLISFFRMLNWMSSSPGGLQTYVGKSGGANALLHDGAAVTPQVEAELDIKTDKGLGGYYLRLLHAAPDTLIFAEERIRFPHPELPDRTNLISASGGRREAMLIEKAEEGNDAARGIRQLLQRCVVYQFHNTSETGRIRQRWDMQDNRFLKEDGANLAPFLLRLRDAQPLAYRRIVETIRQVLPFFADFFLEPTNGTVLLQWRERGTDVVFGSHQASDGALRVMALLALLLQPIEDLPNILILDEPELGLHPYAINVVAGLVKSASLHKQIILATQSMTFIDYFDPEDVIVVNRHGRESEFVRLDPAPLQEWLAEYSLSELWEKNVLGGRPSR